MTTKVVVGHPCLRNRHCRYRYYHPEIAVGDVAGAVVVGRRSIHRRRHGTDGGDGDGQGSGGDADGAGIAWGLCTWRPQRPPPATHLFCCCCSSPEMKDHCRCCYCCYYYYCYYCYYY